MKTYRIISRVVISSVLLMVTGCTHPQEVLDASPAHFWGGVGFSYETTKSSGGKRYRSGPTGTTVIGFEKQLGGGLGIGAEFVGSGN